MTFEEKLMIYGEEKKAEEQERIIYNMMQAGLDDQMIMSCVADVTEEEMAMKRREWRSGRANEKKSLQNGC